REGRAGDDRDRPARRGIGLDREPEAGDPLEGDQGDAGELPSTNPPREEAGGEGGDDEERRDQQGADHRERRRGGERDRKEERQVERLPAGPPPTRGGRVE